MSALLTFQVVTGSESQIFRNFMTDAELFAQLLQTEAGDGWL